MSLNAEPIEDGGSLEDFPVDRQSCKLLGKTALIVQAVMGVVVIASLVYKRHRETPKRPWRIWMFDVCKQVIGQMFVHGTNVLISDVGSARSAGNACVYYFLNILIDTTFGVAIIYFILHLLTWLFTEKVHLKGFESGQYGSPPSKVYWLRQAGVYVVALTTMKLLVIGLFFIWPGIFKVGAWLLSWLGHSNAVQVIFTMGVFPILMNVLQFWLIDSIVKGS
ncbi:vacuolar membrane protein-domain-containing protein, partial [Amylostereum chailletii]